MAEYEFQRLANIEANKKLLEALGLSTFQPADLGTPGKALLRSVPSTPVKRKASTSGKSGRKAQRGEGVPDTPTSIRVAATPTRRSERSKTPTRRYADADDSDIDDDVYDSQASEEESDADAAPQRNPNKSLGGPRAPHFRTPERFTPYPHPPSIGSIPGIPVGTTWAFRSDCSYDGVHRPFVAGIHGSVTEGCYSVALSGGYEDDVDLGELFTYTGSGGRDLKGTPNQPKNLRTAPQSKDQQLVGGNLSLKISCDTRKPVRVIRGYKCPSVYAPSEGYRYDGLYVVEKFWEEVGLGGFKVFKCVFRRLPGQPELSGGGAAAEVAVAEQGTQTEVEVSQEAATE